MIHPVFVFLAFFVVPGNVFVIPGVTGDDRVDTACQQVHKE